MAFSTSTANEILNAYLRGEAPVVPAGIFVSLHTANPGADGASEVQTAVWPGYVRQDAAGGEASSSGWSEAAGGVVTNQKQMIFPGNDGVGEITVTHFALWSSQQGGRCLFVGKLGASRTLQPSDELVIYAGNLTVTTAIGIAA